MKALYHYTCGDHGGPLIAEAGEVRPGSWGLAWFTDLAVPDRAALGLQGPLARCDRTRYRFRATEEEHLVPWVAVRRNHPKVAALLEATPGVRLMHWWVSTRPVPVMLDPR